MDSDEAVIFSAREKVNNKVDERSALTRLSRLCQNFCPVKRPQLCIALAAGVAVSIGIGLFFGKSSRPPAAPAAVPAKDITVRNATPDPIRFEIKVHESRESPRIIELFPGELERFPAPTVLILTYRRGEAETTQALIPGNPYVFRPDEEDLPKLYGGSHMREDAEDLAPYIRTPPQVVEAMLDLASVGPEDVLFDLGCGDGRIVIAAAKRGARGIGVDIDPARIQEAEAAARKAGVRPRVQFRVEDAMTADISAAKVVTLYLLPETNLLLRPKLERELKPGAIVVSHNYRMAGWEDRLAKTAEVCDAEGGVHFIYAYRR
jgi:hypothetical protein